MHTYGFMRGHHYRIGIIAWLLSGGVDTSSLTNDKQKNIFILYQGCALEACRSHRQLAFAFGRLKKNLHFLDHSLDYAADFETHKECKAHISYQSKFLYQR